MKGHVGLGVIPSAFPLAIKYSRHMLYAQAHTKKHISLPGALTSVILYLPLFPCYGKEMLEDKQRISQKRCSQEEVTREQKGQFHRVLALRLAVMH